MLILRSPFDNLWKNKDAFEEVEKISGEVYRSVATRQTLRFEQKHFLLSYARIRSKKRMVSD